MNFGGNSNTDQAMATSSSSSSSSFSTDTSSTSSSINNPNTISSNNDIGEGKGLMMDPSPMSDKNQIFIADAPVSGHDNTIGETNAQTGFQFNACRADPNMDEKKHRRTMSNRLSAERTRKKRAQYVSELERKLKILEVRIAVQRPQISQDKEHVQFLQMEHLKRLNKILTDKKNGLMRIDGIYGVNPAEMNRLNQHVMNQPAASRFNQHVTMNQPTVNRLNQVVMNQPAVNRLNEHVTMNQPTVNRLNQVVMNQPAAANRLNEHVTVNQPPAVEYHGTNGHERLINNMFNNKHIIINQPVTNDHQYGSARALQNAHKMRINNNRLNQQVIMNQTAAVEHGNARIETNDGHHDELLMNSNILNQQTPMNHQVLVNQPAAAVECAQTETNGGHELLVNSNWLNQQQVPVNRPAAMVYGVAPAETNGGHELLILNSNRLNQQVPMNQSAAAEYGGSTNDYQLLMNYQPQPGQMMVSRDNWDQLGMDLQMPNQLPGQMMAPPDNWDQLGMVQMPNPNSNMTINPNC
ncbi:hypothetical protein LWI28_023051 [Acer negundo]|uniref:BZIP domain-containing protein n=1 Tax=Acer negundo TaxID=4023 RepID=A0AAD5JNB6_ACENE|nr:hypothetical protein LWI28_023051 [Acer negundo]